MKPGNYFPAMIEEKNGGYFDSAIGWELTNIHSRDLTYSMLGIKSPSFSSDSEAILFSCLHQNRTAFLQAFSKFPSELVLRLNLTTLPDLEYPFRGNIHYSLILGSQTIKKDDGAALLLQYFQTMQALLNSCFPEAEFKPVFDNQKLFPLVKPFSPRYSTFIDRFSQKIILAKPKPHKTIDFIPPATKPILTEPVIDYLYPWVPNFDPQDKLLRFLLYQFQPVWIQFQICPAKSCSKEKEALFKIVEVCDAYLSGTIASKTVYVNQANLLKEQAFRKMAAMEGGRLNMRVLIFTLNAPDPALISLLGNSITKIHGKDHFDGLLQGNFTSHSVPLEEAFNPFCFPGPDSFSPNEVAAAFKLPLPPQDELPGIVTKRFRSSFAQLPPDILTQSDAALLGINVHRGLEQPVFCRQQDRLRHMCILGSTGTGKSKFMENLILQDIRNGSGLCLIDPHGELIDNILGKIPEAREKDIILLNPLDIHFPIGFNLLEWKTLEERDQIIDELYGIFDKEYDMRQTGGPVFEQYYRTAMRIFLGDQKRPGFTPTLVEFQAFFLHEEFRTWLAKTSNDQQAKDSLTECERISGENSWRNISVYITSKINRFVNDTTLRRMIGQEKTPFDFKEIMDQKKILLINLAKGRFGSYVSSLLAGAIVGRFKNAAMSRGDQPEKDRVPFFLYCDEFQNLPNDEFQDLLAEARKYRLGLILANQFAGQLENKNPQAGNMLKSMLGNVSTWVVFRLGIEDAKALSPLFYPTFNEMDLKELPNWQAYVSFNIEGNVLLPFNIETQLDRDPLNPETRDRIIKHSRKFYGNPDWLADKQIQMRRKFFNDKTRPAEAKERDSDSENNHGGIY